MRHNKVYPENLFLRMYIHKILEMSSCIAVILSFKQSEIRILTKDRLATESCNVFLTHILYAIYKC